MSFGAETTGQPGLGFDDIVSWGINTPDDGNVGLDGNETVVQNNEELDTAGYDEMIRRASSRSPTSAPGRRRSSASPSISRARWERIRTRNTLNVIYGARVVGGNTISVGQETVPMKGYRSVGLLPCPPSP